MNVSPGVCMLAIIMGLFGKEGGEGWAADVVYEDTLKPAVSAVLRLE